MKDLFKRIFSFLSQTDLLLLLMVAAVLMGMIFANPVTRKGDGVEYMMTTEALWFDHSLEFSPNVIQRHNAIKPASVDDGGYIVNQGRDGKSYLTQHPLYYSLFNVPLFGAISMVSKKAAFYSFALMNVIYFMAVLVMLIYYFKVHLKYKNYPYLVIPYLIFATVTPYLLWPHPEMFIFFNIAFYFFTLLVAKKPYLSSIFLGLAAGQSIVLVFLAISLAYVLFFEGKINLKKIIFSFFIFAVTASIHYLVTYIYTGHFFSLAYNSKFSWLALKDVIYAIFDPSVGLVWFYPMTLFSLYFFRKSWINLLIVLSVLTSLTFYMINSQFYTHQVALRYLVYLYPAFFFIVDLKKVANKVIPGFILIMLSAILTAGIFTDISRSNDSMDPTVKNFTAYRILSKVLFPYYKEHPNVFLYHSTLINNKLPQTNEWSAFRMFADNQGGNIYSNGGWLINKTWTRLMLNPVNPGTMEIVFDQDCDRINAIFNNKRIANSSKNLIFNVDKKTIYHTDKRDQNMTMSDYVYIDFMADASCPIRGVEKIFNNHRQVFQRL